MKVGDRMNELFVRQATIEDLNEVTILFNEYRIFYGQETDLEGAKQFLLDRFEHSQSIIFVVTENHQFIGFTQLYPSFSSVSMKRSWILNDLFVVETCRGNGVARLLLEAAKKFTTQTNAKGISLSTSISNERAQSIYERYGFEKENEFFHYYLTI